MTQPLPCRTRPRWCPSGVVDATTGGPRSGRYRHAPIRPNRPERVVRNLPGVTVGIDEHPRVAAPGGGRTGPADRGPRRLRLSERGVDRRRGTDVVRQRDAPPPARILDRWRTT